MCRGPLSGMDSQKVIVTHRGALTAKYSAAVVKKIDAAIAKLIAADTARGFKSSYIGLDVAADMKPFGAAVKGSVTAAKCKAAIDRIVAKLSPDYVALLGSGDIIPEFVVPNPSGGISGDDEADVPTDNPYASSQKFAAGTLASYLLPDRVIGRIPDLPGATDKSGSFLLDTLAASAAWKPMTADDYKPDMMVCADEWAAAGIECATTLGRDVKMVLSSPPEKDGLPQLLERSGARLHMIKCHGNALDAQFYGQQGGDYPPAMRSTALVGKTVAGTVVGAMCCFGSALYDPSDPAAVVANAPAIASVYLKQGAVAFAGSTTVAWVGVQQAMDADVIITAFLRNVLRGASTGRAFLEAKQDFFRHITEAGRQPDAMEEKTLVQFRLLGDPSLHVVPAAAGVAVAAMMAKKNVTAGAANAVANERHARRVYRAGLARELRAYVPAREVVTASKKTSQALMDGVTDARMLRAMEGNAPVVHRVHRVTAAPESKAARALARLPVVAGVVAAAMPSHAGAVQEETLQYYFGHRHEGEDVPVVDATMVSVETDRAGNVLRRRMVVSA